MKTKTFRIVVCSLVASAAALAGSSVASAGGLVGMYVYRDAYGRGLLISSFIPGTSAQELRMAGELYSGDLITYYDGQRVSSPAQIRAISRRAVPGEWLVMEFRTPDGRPFWHYVRPGGRYPEPVSSRAGGVRRPATPTSAEFRVGASRSRGGAPPARPGRPSSPGRPRGPGRR